MKQVTLFSYKNNIKDLLQIPNFKWFRVLSNALKFMFITLQILYKPVYMIIVIDSAFWNASLNSLKFRGISPNGLPHDVSAVGWKSIKTLILTKEGYILITL